jgi:hypothetical protein
MDVDPANEFPGSYIHQIDDEAIRTSSSRDGSMWIAGRFLPHEADPEFGDAEPWAL